MGGGGIFFSGSLFDFMNSMKIFVSVKTIFFLSAGVHSPYRVTETHINLYTELKTFFISLFKIFLFVTDTNNI